MNKNLIPSSSSLSLTIEFDTSSDEPFSKLSSSSPDGADLLPVPRPLVIEAASHCDAESAESNNKFYCKPLK